MARSDARPDVQLVAYVRRLPASEARRRRAGQDPRDFLVEALDVVVRADVVSGPDGTSKGFGTVLFGSTREAAKAIQIFNESDYNGRLLQVRPDAHA